MPLVTLAAGDDPFDYSEEGAGRPILFLHGAPGDKRTFAPVIALLRDRFRGLTYTQRWFGPQAWSPGGPVFSTQTHADDLARLIEVLNLAPVSLVAWSFSGHVALAAALARPDLFAKVLIYEPSVGTYVTGAGSLAALAADGKAAYPALFEALGRGDLPEVVRRLIDMSGGDGHFDRQAAERRAIHLDSAAAMPLLLGGGAPPADLKASDLAALDVPVSIAWGRHSRPMFAIPSQAAAAAITTALHCDIGGAGHLLPEVDPERFADLVADWMDGALG